MRTIERTTRFKRDYQREKRGRYSQTLDADLMPVIAALLADEVLAPRHRDHALSGNWSGFRDCHIRPDLVLIYEKPDGETLRLIRLGSHAELGL